MLNGMYMRVLRKISGQIRSGEHGPTDREVRESMGAPSIDCIMRRQRLLYLPRLLQHGPPSLAAMLQATAGDKAMRWACLIKDDLIALQKGVPEKLEQLPSPVDDPQPWYNLIADYGGQWCQLVKMLHYTESACDRRTLEHHSTFGLAHVFVCRECPAPHPSFYTQKALASHERVKHGRRNKYRLYIDEGGICPVCKTDLHTRLR
eukprot:2456427-Karenia_brevis.AAC.1